MSSVAPNVIKVHAKLEIMEKEKAKLDEARTHARDHYASYKAQHESMLKAMARVD